MASLSVRNLEETVYERLRVRAAKHGVSMEEEVRRIILQAVTVPEKMSAVFEKNFGSRNGIELELPTRKPHRPLKFEK
jgi:plasmid stability protein